MHATRKNYVIGDKIYKQPTVFTSEDNLKSSTNKKVIEQYENNRFIKIDGYWWRVVDSSALFCKPGNTVRVENRNRGYHYHKIANNDEIKWFENPMDAWLENDLIEEAEYNAEKYSEESSEITSFDYTNKYGKLEGYITKEGRFIDVSGYNDTSAPSVHQIYCDECGFDEEQLLKERQWVKLSKVLPYSYIFYGMRLSPEQIHTLEEMGYEIDEFDKC